MFDWGEFSIDVASERDVELVTALRQEAAGWLAARHVAQWSPGDEATAGLSGPIEQGRVFVLRHGRELAGTVMVLWEDPVIWGEQPVPAGYIHNLVVARCFAGQGLGRRLMQWAEDHISHSGRSVVRLDCVASNAPLRELYESVGYHWVADKSFPEPSPGRSVALYEKVLLAS